jgi:hypothetical protein
MLGTGLEGWATQWNKRVLLRHVMRDIPSLCVRIKITYVKRTIEMNNEKSQLLFVLCR